MHCHNCESMLDWDGSSPIAICEICCCYRCVEIPDSFDERIILLDRPGKFRCPCCRRRLTQAGLSGLKVEHCAGCQGVLLTDDVFAMFVRNRRTEFRAAARQPVVRLPEPLREAIPCPACRRAMHVHPHHGPDLMIIDACIGCGMVWLESRQPPCAAYACHGLTHASSW